MAAKENFLKAHWDWLVLVAGLALLALAFVHFMGAFGESAEDAAAHTAARLKAMPPANEGVAETDLGIFRTAFLSVKTPPRLAAVDSKEANFLTSERRMFCRSSIASTKKACGRPIPADVDTCPFCGAKQSLPEKVELDNDHDGLPNDWEVKFGLNPNNNADAVADTDKDGFTNLEEFKAGTNPKDAKSHPDYLDSLFAKGAPRQTTLPFYLNVANPMPDGKGGTTWRVTFQRLQVKNKYEDRTFRVKVGDPIKSADGKIDSGFVLVSCKMEKIQVAVRGFKGKKITKELAVAEVRRVADGKVVTMREGEKRISVDMEADLVYRRGEEKTFTVHKGSEITLNGQKYRILSLNAEKGKVKVMVEDFATKKQKAIMPLD